VAALVELFVESVGLVMTLVGLMLWWFFLQG
jgi:hypothetical protein